MGCNSSSPVVETAPGKCIVKGCNREPEGSRNYCKKHTCAITKCYSFVIVPGELYCEKHICPYNFFVSPDLVYKLGDNSIRCSSWYMCKDHICRVKGCKLPVCSTRTASKKYVPHKYCANHECSVQNCRKFRIPAHFGCENHICKATGCRNAVEQAGKMCMDHYQTSEIFIEDLSIAE